MSIKIKVALFDENEKQMTLACVRIIVTKNMKCLQYQLGCILGMIVPTPAATSFIQIKNQILLSKQQLIKEWDVIDLKMSLPLHFLTLFLLTFLFPLVTTSVWANWNNPTFQNISSYPALPSTSLGSFFTRYNPANPASVFANDRKTQYKWDLIVGGQPICNIYCGPKSYLTVDPNDTNNLVCKRDMNNKYWAGQTNEGTTYFEYCIPHRSDDCSTTNSNLRNLKNLPTKCSAASYISTYADKLYDCCFNNDGGGLYHTQMKDEVDISVTSSPTGLRMSQ